MEIVSWLTTGEIDIAWPGVSPAIAEYIQVEQDGRSFRAGDTSQDILERVVVAQFVELDIFFEAFE
jgi:hypothetical protein